MELFAFLAACAQLRPLPTMSGLEGERPQRSKAGTSYGVRADAGDASPDEEEPTPRIVRKSGSKSPGLSAASAAR